jgi:hypothetical protein
MNKINYYISFEQESILSDHFPLTVTHDRLDHGYVVISDVAWGDEGLDWKPTLIGPIKETEFNQDILNQIATLLRVKGCRVAVCGVGDLRDERGYEIPT